MRPRRATICSCTSSAPRADGAAAAWPELAMQVRGAAAPRLPASLLRLPPRPGAGAGAAADGERRGGRGAARDVRVARPRGGAGDRPQRRRSRARPARGGGCARRPTPRASAARWSPTAARSPTSSSAPTATSSTWSSTRRRAIATARRSRSWPTTTAAAAPVWSRRWSSSSPTAAASARAPGRSTCTRTRSASGSSGSSGSPSSTFRSEDLLSLELALKLARLHDVRTEAE